MSAVGNGPAEYDREGLYRKYEIKRLDPDGYPLPPGGPHDTCFMFVLDPAHDSEAWFALSRYAELCIQRGRKQPLALALLDKLEEVRKTHDYRTE